MNHRTAYLLAALLLTTASVAADDRSWSRFRGPNGSGISEATTVPVQWTPQDYNWKVALPGPGHSSPIVCNKRIYVLCGDPETALRSVLCLDTADGHTLWRRDYPSKTHTLHRDNGYASSTPVADAAGLVVTWSTPEGIILLALDHDGREVWRRDLGPLISVQGSGASPTLIDDLVVLPNDQEDPSLIPGHKKDPPEPIGKSSLIAVDRRTGKTRWEIPRRTLYSAYSTPCIYRHEDGRAELIFTSSAHGMTAVDPANGKVNWEMDDLFKFRCVSSPVAVPGLVIAGHGGGSRGTRYVAVRPGSSEKGRKPELAYDVTKAIPMVLTPIVKGDRLYLWTDDGIVSCLKLSLGEVVWQERVGAAFYSSPVWVNGRLYCISKTGEVFVVAAADKFEVLGRVSLGEPSFATPAVADGVMYLRTRGQLFSLGGKK